MQVPVDTDEDLLHQVLRLLPIPDRAIDEVEQARLVALHQLLERTLLSPQKRCDDRCVVHRVQLFADRRPLLGNPLHCGVSHGSHPRYLRKGHASTTQSRCPLSFLVSCPLKRHRACPLAAS